MVKGIDISHYEGDIQWPVLKNDGFQFVFMKATQNITPDPTFSKHWNYLNNNDFGILKGAYHFFDTSADPEKQAETFCFVVGQLKATDLPMVVDIEEDKTNGALTLADRIKNLNIFLTTVEKLSGKKPIIYSYLSFFNNYFQGSTTFNSYPLWVASYPSQDTFNPNDSPPSHIPHLSCGWENYVFWQYTENGLINGADNAGDKFDLNVFNGDFNSLVDFINKSSC